MFEFNSRKETWWNWGTKGGEASKTSNNISQMESWRDREEPAHQFWWIWLLEVNSRQTAKYTIDIHILEWFCSPKICIYLCPPIPDRNHSLMASLFSFHPRNVYVRPQRGCTLIPKHRTYVSMANQGVIDISQPRYDPEPT